jgi:hypothetical protein
MAKSHSVEHDSESTNSFLDVITSSIGILIILVMVAGQRSQQAIEQLARAPLDAELKAAQNEAVAVEQDIHNIAQQTAIVQNELAARSAQRGQVSTLIRAIEQELAERRAALDQNARQRYDLERDLAIARDQLDRLETERGQVSETAAPESIKIENYPTPLSKTVDDQEAHFQLIGGRLAYVPFDTLVDRLKGTLRDYASKLQDQGELSDTLGPIGGFRLRYNIERHDTNAGSYMQVSYIEFLPTSSQLGEPIDEALAAQSALRKKLEMMSPRQYTITVWTYPDSFDEFRRLKKELYGMGYAVAARPLPTGMPIGASPQGSRSSSQ